MVHGAGGTLVALSALAAAGHREAADLARAGMNATWSAARGEENRFGRIDFGVDGSLGAMTMHTLKWCQGDPGVLRALWLTARTLGDEASARRALDALRADAERDARDGWRDRDARIDLCCGAAAVAQVHTRMHRETGEEAFGAASRALLAHCAERLDGYEVASFQYGKRGALLALLSAERPDVDPIWDAMLGMSLPRRLPAERRIRIEEET
jgi:hypothetical protein